MGGCFAHWCLLLWCFSSTLRVKAAFSSVDCCGSCVYLCRISVIVIILNTSLFKVLQLDDNRATPAVVNNDGRDFVPTNKISAFWASFCRYCLGLVRLWVLSLRHKSAICQV